MRLIIVVLAFLSLLPAAVQAQTVTTKAKATWVQPNTVADAMTFAYVLKDGTTKSDPVTGAVCAVTQGVVVCNGDVPLPGPGPHQFTLVATSADGALSAASPILVSVMPGAPSGFKVNITITIVP